MRTRKEWFDLLPEDVREQAMKNVISENGIDYQEFMLLKHKNMWSCLNASFVFEFTNEGDRYWSKIASDPKWK